MSEYTLSGVTDISGLLYVHDLKGSNYQRQKDLELDRQKEKRSKKERERKPKKKPGTVETQHLDGIPSHPIDF